MEVPSISISSMAMTAEKLVKILPVPLRPSIRIMTVSPWNAFKEMLRMAHPDRSKE